MRKTVLLLVLLLLSSLLTGCGTIIHGKYQTVPVSSEPSGAQVRSSSGQTCITPCELNLLRDNEYVLVAELDGYHAQQTNLGKDTSGWFWGNIILGGIVGGAIDKATGSGDKLVPAKVHIDFTKGKVFGAKEIKDELVEMKVKENEAVADTNPPNAGNKIPLCANCEHEIGKLEKSYSYKDNIVCKGCYAKLETQPKAKEDDLAKTLTEMSDSDVATTGDKEKTQM
ncbi:MAG: PEGA domain-containing protein [Planctomycetes bacterium]|nr:PEGA domain-containing protein [Planctomycetota bacterium]